MGSSTSAALPHLERCCAAIQLLSRRQENLGTIIAVPVCPHIFRDTTHPLFQQLHLTRNEPSVRHWYLPKQGTCTEWQRTEKLYPEISENDYHAELFGSPGTEEEEVLTSRWMIICVPGGVSRHGFLSVADVCRMILPTDEEASPASVAGYLECQHPDENSLKSQPSILRYWLAKTFCTEGRSLVLFQIAAFMELRRMELALLRPVNPTAIEWRLRPGDCCSIRALESCFRHLKSANASPSERITQCAHENVTVTPVRCSSPQEDHLAIRLCIHALNHVLPGLERAVQGALEAKLTLVMHLSAMGSSKGSPQLSPTPFESAITTAKPLWIAQNRVVSESQPSRPHLGTRVNRKEMRKKFFQATKSQDVVASHLSSSVESAQVAGGRLICRAGACVIPTERNRSSSPSSSVGSLGEPFVCSAPSCPLLQEQNHGDLGMSPRSAVGTQRHFTLPHNTPLHLFHRDTASWEALWLNSVSHVFAPPQFTVCPGGASGVFPAADNISLQCLNPMSLTDKNGREKTVNPIRSDVNASDVSGLSDWAPNIISVSRSAFDGSFI